MSNPLLEVRHTKLVFPNGQLALNDVSCSVSKGEILCLIGPSGCGKSTLLRCFNRLAHPDSGELLFHGEPVPGGEKAEAALRQKVGMVFQEFAIFKHLDVLSNVTIGPVRILGMDPGQAREKGMALLREVGLAEKAHVLSTNLSGGEKQRVEIARCLSMDPEVMLLDEPTAALDPRMTAEVKSVIMALAKKGMTMVITTHDMQLAREISSRIVFMQNGLIQETGTPDEIFDHPKKTVTRIFVENQLSLLFHVNSRDYDLYNMNAQIEWFCARYELGKLYFPLELLLEELLTKVLPFTGPVDIRIHEAGGAGADRNPGSSDGPVIAIEIEQSNCRQPILDGPDVDEISLMIIRGMAAQISEEQADKSRLIHLEVHG